MKNHIRLSNQNRERVNALADGETRPVSAMANILIGEALKARTVQFPLAPKAATGKKGASK